MAVKMTTDMFLKKNQHLNTTQQLTFTLVPRRNKELYRFFWTRCRLLPDGELWLGPTDGSREQTKR